MENLAKYIVSELIDKKDALTISTEEESPKVTIIHVSVDKDDVGKVIGRNGQVAGSIRKIIKSASAKTGKRFIVKIGERD